MPSGRPWRSAAAIDRPVMPPPERRLLHRQHQHLHEALVLGAALDLVDRVFDVLHRHHDRGAQARIAVEPFLGDPVVERAREAPRAMSSLKTQLHAVEAVAGSRCSACQRSNTCARELLGVGRRIAVLAAPIRPRGDRRVRRIADGFERGDAALHDRVAPERRRDSGSSALMSGTVGCTSQSMARGCRVMSLGLEVGGLGDLVPARDLARASRRRARPACCPRH